MSSMGSMGSSLRVGLGLVVGLSLVVGLAAQQRPTFRGSARFVRVDVYPTDANGKPIEGLTAADFELYEDGKPQAIDTFDFVRIEPEPEALRADPNSQKEGEAAARDPRARVFAIVLDTRHVDIASGRSLQRPLAQMLDRLIGPRDLFGVITPQLPPSSFLLGRRSLTTADMLQRHWVWGTHDNILPQDAMEQLFDSCYGPVKSMARDRNQDPELTRDLVARYRERQTLEFLDGLIDKLASIREERKVLILLTHGWRLFGENRDLLRRAEELSRRARPAVSTEGGRIFMGTPPQRGDLVDRTDCLAQATSLFLRDSRRTFRDLTQKAARANVAIYPLDPGGLRVFDQSIAMGVNAPTEELARISGRAEGLREMAINTDGIALIANNDIDAQFRVLTDSMSAYYLLGYYSTNAKFDGGYRRIEVKVKRPGGNVKARRGYVAPTEGEIAAIAAGREAANAPVPADEAALSDALARLDELRHDRDIFVQTTRAGGALLVNVELGVSARRSPAWAEGGEVRVTLSGIDGEQTETRAIEPMRAGAAFRLQPPDEGPVTLSVRARAKLAGPVSAAETGATAAGVEASLLGAILTWRGIPRALQPAADGRYRRTERATIEAPLAAGAVPIGARLLDRQGKALNVPVTTRERADADGVRWMVAEPSLAPLAEGDYVVELEVMKDEQRERRLFAIRVVR